MVDLGLTHVALPVSNLNDSIAFYTTYGPDAGGAPSDGARDGIRGGVAE